MIAQPGGLQPGRCIAMPTLRTTAARMSDWAKVQKQNSHTNLRLQQILRHNGTAHQLNGLRRITTNQAFQVGQNSNTMPSPIGKLYFPPRYFTTENSRLLVTSAQAASALSNAVARSIQNKRKPLREQTTILKKNPQCDKCTKVGFVRWWCIPCRGSGVCDHLFIRSQCRKCKIAQLKESLKILHAKNKKQPNLSVPSRHISTSNRFASPISRAPSGNQTTIVPFKFLASTKSGTDVLRQPSKDMSRSEDKGMAPATPNFADIDSLKKAVEHENTIRSSIQNSHRARYSGTIWPLNPAEECKTFPPTPERSPKIREKFVRWMRTKDGKAPWNLSNTSTSPRAVSPGTETPAPNLKEQPPSEPSNESTSPRSKWVPIAPKKRKRAPKSKPESETQPASKIQCTRSIPTERIFVRHSKLLELGDVIQARRYGDKLHTAIVNQKSDDGRALLLYYPQLEERQWVTPGPRFQRGVHWFLKADMIWGVTLRQPARKSNLNEVKTVQTRLVSLDHEKKYLNL